MHDIQNIKKKLSISKKNEIRFNRANNNYSNVTYIPQNYEDKKPISTEHTKIKKNFFFKKTFSRLVYTQSIYQIRFLLKNNLKKPEFYYIKDNIIDEINFVSWVNSKEWSKFDIKKILYNFLYKNIAFYIENFVDCENFISIFFQDGNFVKNSINESIFLSCITEYILFLKNLSENDELNDKKIADHKNILINEYILIINEFSDDFYIKNINGIFENAFSQISNDFNLKKGFFI